MWNFNASLKSQLGRVVFLGSKSGDFTQADGWSLTREKKAELTWHRLIWFNPNVPTFCFVSWFAILTKLQQTGDRFCKWQNVNDICVLCGLKPESRRHLFFECSFSSEK